MGHTSVLEHVSITFRVSDVSRSLTHQLVRHRLASYTQLSQRYTQPTFEDDEWYITPPEIYRNEAIRVDFDYAMDNAAKTYKNLIADGIRPEDARFVLPEATKTSIVVTMNLREVMNFYALRADSHAQWEIHALAKSLRMALLENSNDEWKQIVELIMPEEKTSEAEKKDA